MTTNQLQDLPQKYEQAVKLYRTTDLKRTDICRQLNIDYNAFSYFLKTRYPELLSHHNPHKNSEYAVSERKNTEKTYRKALKLCETSRLSYKEIAELMGVSLSGLKTYIAKNRRDILFMRQGIKASKRVADTLRLRKQEAGISLPGLEKYRDAIAACEDINFIELTVSEIAKTFDVPASGLLVQMRDHFPEIMANREKMRQERGLSDNRQRGARLITLDKYAEAIALLRNTEKTIDEAAQHCGVTSPGLRNHLLSYHKDVVSSRRSKTGKIIVKTVASKTVGNNGASKIERVAADNSERYQKALEILREGHTSVESAAMQCGLLPETLRAHLKKYHKDVYLKFGKEKRADGKTVLRRSAEKYKAAIEELQNSTMSLMEVAKKHGLVYNSFTSFIRRNHPQFSYEARGEYKH